MVLILRDGALPTCGICVEGSIVQPCSILHLGMQIAKSCKIPDPLFLSTSKRGFRGCYGPGCAQKKLITTITSIKYTIPEVYVVVINLEAFYRFP